MLLVSSKRPQVWVVWIPSWAHGPTFAATKAWLGHAWPLPKISQDSILNAQEDPGWSDQRVRTCHAGVYIKHHVMVDTPFCCNQTGEHPNHIQTIPCMWVGGAHDNGITCSFQSRLTLHAPYVQSAAWNVKNHAFAS